MDIIGTKRFFPESGTLGEEKGIKFSIQKAYKTTAHWLEGTSPKLVKFPGKIPRLDFFFGSLSHLDMQFSHLKKMVCNRTKLHIYLKQHWWFSYWRGVDNLVHFSIMAGTSDVALRYRMLTDLNRGHSIFPPFFLFSVKILTSLNS